MYIYIYITWYMTRPSPSLLLASGLHNYQPTDILLPPGHLQTDSRDTNTTTIDLDTETGGLVTIGKYLLVSRLPAERGNAARNISPRQDQLSIHGYIDPFIPVAPRIGLLIFVNYIY